MALLSAKISPLLLALVLIGFSWSKPLPAKAQDEFNQLLSDTDLSYQIHQLEEQRSKVPIKRSKAGIITCTILTAFGLSLTFSGVHAIRVPSASLGLGTAIGSSLIASGLLFVIPTTVGLTLSSKRFRDRKREIKEIDRQIAKLEAVQNLKVLPKSRR